MTETIAPKGPDRRNRKVAQLIAAAHDLFLKLPYDDVSTDAIAQKAAVSKTTLYAHFPSKEALFSTLVSDQCSLIAHHVWTSPSVIDDVEEELRRIARNFIAIFASPDALALYRSVANQAARIPELGRMFYEGGPKLLEAHIAGFLAEATALGLIDVPDPKAGAVQFLQLVAADAPMRALLALEIYTQGELDAKAEQGIALFLSGYRAKDGVRRAWPPSPHPPDTAHGES